jgi:predicted nucleotidyltransferase
MYAPAPPGQREALLNEIVGDLSQDPAVVGIFLAGSLAAGTADAHSDIDLRVVVTPSAIADYCAERLERPRQWTGFLFNEWDENNNSCCVSHFEHFAKVDIYYVAADQIGTWLRATAPIRVIHDPAGIVTAARQDARMLIAVPTSFATVEQAVGKATAYAIEVARRLARGELIYAQTLLDAFRDRLVVLEDLLEGQHAVASASHLEKRPKAHLVRSLYRSCDVAEPIAVQATLANLARACRTTVSQLHERSLLKSSPTPFLYVLDQLAAAGHA